MKCLKCNYENKEDALTCGLCGEVLKSKPEPVAAPTETVSQASGAKSCPNHPGRSIAWFCSSCKKDFCADCLTETMGKKLCPDCRGKKFSESRFYRAKELAPEAIKTWWILVGLGLIINYLIPLTTGG